MTELEWKLLEFEQPREDGWYVISYDGDTWRHGIWSNYNKCFNESYGGWSLRKPKWWATIIPPLKIR